MSNFDRDTVELWATELKRMEVEHRVDLNHKDCGELSEILQEILKELDHAVGLLYSKKEVEE